MSQIFKLNMLPARQGDCLWIEYGDKATPSRVIIDGGTPGTYPQLKQAIDDIPQDQRFFDLLVITHIDSDHIGGVLPLLQDKDLGVTFHDIWFNGWRHLPGSGFEEFGPVQGEKLTTRLDVGDLSWNKAFARHPVSIPDSGSLPQKTLPGGLKITLLSPGSQELKRLRPFWEKECKKAGLVPKVPPSLSHPLPPGFEEMGVINIDQLASSPFSGDSSKANASSIALLAEFDGRRILLAGDAHADVLLESIQKLTPPGERLELSAFKLPHHGSKHNLSRELLESLECQRYLFSTDGSQFKHPDKEAAARVIKFGGDAPQLYFNYRTIYNQVWDNTTWKDLHGYSALYPKPGQESMVVKL